MFTVRARILGGIKFLHPSHTAPGPPLYDRDDKSSHPLTLRSIFLFLCILRPCLETCEVGLAGGRSLRNGRFDQFAEYIIPSEARGFHCNTGYMGNFIRRCRRETHICARQRVGWTETPSRKICTPLTSSPCHHSNLDGDGYYFSAHRRQQGFSGCGICLLSHYSTIPSNSILGGSAAAILAHSVAFIFRLPTSRSAESV